MARITASVATHGVFLAVEATTSKSVQNVARGKVFGALLRSPNR